MNRPRSRSSGWGKGSTPQLAALFRRLGIADAEWMRPANATYKTGIAFHGWSESGSRYFHPFASAIDLHTEPGFHAQAPARRQGLDAAAHPDPFFLITRLAAERRAPLPPASDPFEVGHGHHVDAHLVGAVLREEAVRRGAIHRAATMREAVVAPDGTIARLRLHDGTDVAAELFVDASGFAGVLAQGALGMPFRSFAGNLLNEGAVVMPTPVDPAGPAPFTAATALSAGWAWAIPLTTRTGNGYVYSSRYIDDDAAEAELRARLGVGNEGTARRLHMKVGRVATSWTGNCLAIGLAQRFLEPLEATALHPVQATVEGFVAHGAMAA